MRQIQGERNFFTLVELPAGVARKQVVDFVVAEEEVVVVAEIPAVFESGEFLDQLPVALNLGDAVDLEILDLVFEGALGVLHEDAELGILVLTVDGVRQVKSDGADGVLFRHLFETHSDINEIFVGSVEQIVHVDLAEVVFNQCFDGLFHLDGIEFDLLL